MNGGKRISAEAFALAVDFRPDKQRRDIGELPGRHRAIDLYNMNLTGLEGWDFRRGRTANRVEAD